MKKRKKRAVSWLLSVCLVLVMLPAAALAAEGDMSYLYWEESSGSWQTGIKTSGQYAEVQSNEAVLGTDEEENWYVVRGNVSVNNTVEGSAITDNLTVRGTVHLILTDGSQLNCGRLITGANSSLYIHAQTNDETVMGGLTAEDGIGGDISTDTNVRITIDGGRIEAGGNAVPAIGSDQGGHTITVNGGIVTAQNTGYAAGIYGDEVTLRGGRITAGSKGHNGIYGANSITMEGADVSVSADAFNGIYSPGNITVSGGRVNVTAGNGSEATCGILAGEILRITNQAAVEVENKGTAAAMEGTQGIIIDGSEVKSASSISNGILTSGSVEIRNGANVTAEGSFPSIWTKEGAQINGSTVTLLGQSDGIWTPEGSIMIENGSEVKADVTGSALAAGGAEGITVSGSRAELSSLGSNGIFAGTGAIKITDGAAVKAKGNNPALFAQAGIVVSGSSVEADSGQDVGIYSPATAVITNSVVTAKGGDSRDGILVREKQGSSISGSWVNGSFGDSFASVEDTLAVENGIAAVTGAAVVPQDVTLPQGTQIVIPEGSSLKINDKVTILSLPSGENAVVGESGNIELPAGTVVTVDNQEVTVPAEGGSVNFDGDVNIGLPTPTTEPTEGPTAEPTTEPTEGPTAEPTTEPTEGPTAEPTEGPIAEPTEGPTAEPTAEPTPEPVHIHNWSGEWKSDSLHHWHECTAAGCTITENNGKDGYGVHIPSDWITDKQPSAEEAGSRHRECILCGTVLEKESIPAPGNQESSGTPFIRGNSGQKGWTAVETSAKKAEENGTVDVVMNGAAVVPGNILDAVKGRNVTLVFNMGENIVWIVNGKQITAEKAEDINLSVKKNAGDIPADIVQNTAAGNSYVKLSLAHSGNFGFTATLFLDLGKENQGLEAVLYYYNRETGRLESAGRSRISETGSAGFVFTHASEYVVVIEKNQSNVSAPEDNTPEGNGQESDKKTPVSPTTGEAQNTWTAAALGCLIIAAVLGRFSLKKFRQGDRALQSPTGAVTARRQGKE